MTTVLPEPASGPPAEGVLIDAEHRATPGARPGTDPEAELLLERLFAQHYRLLVRLAVLLLRDAGTAEEVVQDSFVAVHRRLLDSDRGLDDPAAYLRQTVVNRSRSVLRHHRVVDRHRPEATGVWPGADEHVLRDDRRRAVLDALARLPRRQREVLALRYYLDLSEREIAATLQISPGAVKSHASRGAAALRQTLSDLLEETP